MGKRQVLGEAGAPIIQAIRSVGVIGSRGLPYPVAEKVGQITEDLIARGYHIASGGARGTDHFVIEKLLKIDQTQHGTVYSAWQNYTGFPATIRATLREFKEKGGSILWGPITGKEPDFMVKQSLLFRNARLVEACYGLVAFLTPDSRGSVFTLKRALEKRLITVVFPSTFRTADTPVVDSGLLPKVDYVKWVPIKCGGCWENGFKAVYLR